MSITNDPTMLSERMAELEQKAKIVAQQLAAQSKKEAVLQELADRLSLLAFNEDMLVEQFERNMQAFRQFDPNIYEFFKDYQPQRYVVDIHEGFPNVWDAEKSMHLYSYPAYLMANVQFENYKKAPQSTAAMFEHNADNKANFIHSTYLNKVIDVFSSRVEQQEELECKSHLRKSLSAMMVFGIGVGYHLELLMQQHDITHLYVVEPELDIFYASLFTTNWQQILLKVESRQQHIHITLGDNEDTFFQNVLVQSNRFGKYDITKTFGFIHTHTEKIRTFIKKFDERFHESMRGWGFFDDAVMSIGHMLTSMKQGVPLLKKRDLNHNDLSDYPVLIIGNGPSLDGLIDTIKMYQDKAILISCGSALSALYQYGITPDIHCEQERTFPVVEKLSYYCPKAELEKMAFIGPTTIHPEIFNQFDVKLMAAKSQEPSSAMLMETKLGQEQFEIHRYINPTVANTAFTIAHGLGFNHFYFLGVDLAHKVDGHHHSSKSLYYSQDGEDLDLYGYQSLSTIPVEGNFGGEFCTEPFFNNSRIGLERLIKEAEGIHCYNLSDGAKIQGCQPLSKEEFIVSLPVIDSKYSSIKSLFESASHIDVDHSLLSELVELVDYDGYEALCHRLIEDVKDRFVTSEQCLSFLKQQSHIITDSALCKYDHFYYLLTGSITHMQAMLTRVLYEAFDEQDAIADFNEAVQHYKSFLLHSVQYYREHALKPHYCETDWFEPLTKFED